MYENGKKVSGYQKMREHKRRMKDRFLKNPGNANIEKGKTYEEYLATTNEADRTKPIGCRHLPYAQQYWRLAYNSNEKKEKKKYTVKASRNEWKEVLNKKEYETELID
jgi:hypothetical protein